MKPCPYAIELLLVLALLCASCDRQRSNPLDPRSEVIVESGQRSDAGLAPAPPIP